jgi:tRNA-splicing ligase RtcB (3'-phosphate/5'-hydroxy nucleic acid ligase)
VTDPGAAPVREWIAEKTPAPVRQAIERIQSSDDVSHVAVLPDVHRAEEVCVGLAVATRQLLYPALVGGDIGCGMLAVAFDAGREVLSDQTRARSLLADLGRGIPCQRHGAVTAAAECPAALLRQPLSDPRLEREKSRDGRVQLGTLGRGNHFVELQADGDDRLWLMLHSGSRGMGQMITTHHLRNAAVTNSGLPALDIETEAGRAYLNDVQWGVSYAAENRLAMARAVERSLRGLFRIEADWSTLIHGDHNHIRREEHSGQTWLVHRKGALPAGHDEPGVIPGSMGTCSFHVAGRGCAESLMSSSHGAGRTLPRSEARQRIRSRELRRQLGGVWFDDELLSALCEEAPAAYKDIRKVMRAQRELTRITRELRPVLVYKGR